MTNEEFEKLVSRLDAQAAVAPERYQAKVLALAFMGAGYLVLMLAVLVGVLAALFATIATLRAAGAKLILLVGVFLWVVVKALWVKVPPPEGAEIHRSQAPELFDMIDELRLKLGAPHFHHVLVTDDFNAGVTQSPRLGIFGWPRNYLMLGLPLMKSLTPQQLKAVLGHEFGHLARGHAKWSNWIYRQRLRWARLIEVLEERSGFGTFIFKPFLTWFVPYFNAYSFPLARQNEYQADAAAAQLTSPRSLAEALTGIDVVARFLGERYWPGIHRQADDQPAPAFTPYVAFGHRLASELDETSARTWLDESMAVQTGTVDTHPALPDRLKAVGESPQLALPGAGEAADRLLGSALAAITAEFDRRWQSAVQASWEERYQDVQEKRRRLAELNERFLKGEELSVDDAFVRARLTESTGGEDEGALEQFRLLHERAPDDAVVCMFLGARLLARDDEAGCALVEKALSLDPEGIITGCELLRDYHWRAGRKEEAQAWHDKLLARAELLEKDDKERGHVFLNDKFMPHGLDEAAVSELRSALQTVPGLRKAFFVRKRTVQRPDTPCYVLGYSVSGLFQWHRQERADAVLQEIQQRVRFPGETLIICIDGDNYRFGRKLRWSRGARVL